MILDIKTKDLVWEDCEEFEYPYLISSSSITYGYIVMESTVGYSLSIYLLSGGGDSELHHYFGTVEGAQNFAISHHYKVMDCMLHKYWDIL